MVSAELADLRELVARLPRRQRAAVIMCYWQDAQERDIAPSLGVTPRRPRHACPRRCKVTRHLRA
jgi:DNA-directed RNA polymerase specialized sigma24 family protein